MDRVNQRKANEKQQNEWVLLLGMIRWLRGTLQLNWTSRDEEGPSHLQKYKN